MLIFHILIPLNQQKTLVSYKEATKIARTSFNCLRSNRINLFQALISGVGNPPLSVRLVPTGKSLFPYIPSALLISNKRIIN